MTVLLDDFKRLHFEQYVCNVKKEKSVGMMMMKMMVMFDDNYGGDDKDDGGGGDGDDVDGGLY